MKAKVYNVMIKEFEFILRAILHPKNTLIHIDALVKLIELYYKRNKQNDKMNVGKKLLDDELMQLQKRLFGDAFYVKGFDPF